MTETTAAAPAAVTPAPETVLGTAAPAAAPAAPAVAPTKLVAPAGSGLDDKYIEGVSAWAAQNKYDPAIAQAVIDRDAARVSDENKAAAENKEKALTALKAAYTPDTLHDMDVAVTGFVRTHFGDDIVKWMQDTGVIFERRIFDAFAKLAKAGRESPMAPSQTPTGATESVGKKNFPRSPINWSPAERAAWEAAGSPQL